MTSIKCSKSPNGKHVWKYRVEGNRITGEEMQYRKCEKCGLEERQEKDLFRRSKGWKT